MSKVIGPLLALVGAICTTLGIIKRTSWEYQLADAFGAASSSVEIILWAGIIMLLLGIACIIGNATGGGE